MNNKISVKYPVTPSAPANKYFDVQPEQSDDTSKKLIKKEHKSARVQLLLKPSLLEKIKATAAESGLSVNETVGQILEQFYTVK